MIRSYLFGILLLIVSALIETAILSNIFFLPAIPDLLLICSLYFSVNNGCVYGETLAFSSGLFIDFLCVIQTVLGCSSSASMYPLGHLIIALSSLK